MPLFSTPHSTFLQRLNHNATARCALGRESAEAVGYVQRVGIPVCSTDIGSRPGPAAAGLRSCVSFGPRS
jgi:hypothetical protein